MTEKYLIWDFDGTLGYRLGGFTEALLVCIRDLFPEIPITADLIRPFIANRFPWSMPEKTHVHIKTADQWWENLYPILENACIGTGLEQHAHELARSTRRVYLDIKYWRLFDDTEKTLIAMRELGWSQVIFTNHVPEIDSVIRSLGIEGYIGRIFNSAYLGYEKPHPNAYGIVLEALGGDSKKVMAGDNIDADVRGAEAAGIPCILVRKEDEAARYYAATLADLPEIAQEMINAGN